jgi:hypothetical protein
LGGLDAGPTALLPTGGAQGVWRWQTLRRRAQKGREQQNQQGTGMARHDAHIGLTQRLAKDGKLKPFVRAKASWDHHNRISCGNLTEI